MFCLPLGCGSQIRQPGKHKYRNGFEQECKPFTALGKPELLTQADPLK